MSRKLHYVTPLLASWHTQSETSSHVLYSGQQDSASPNFLSLLSPLLPMLQMPFYHLLTPDSFSPWSLNVSPAENSLSRLLALLASCFSGLSSKATTLKRPLLTTSLLIGHKASLCPITQADVFHGI